MKKPIILFVILFAARMSPADFVIHWQSVALNGFGVGVTNDISVSIHGNMKRTDSGSERFGHGARIDNMSTLDRIVLHPEAKDYYRISGVKVEEWQRQQEEQYNDTNSQNAAQLLPITTGKYENVNGFQTEIYFWTNGRDITNRLWVAKDYPNHEAIKPYLSELDDWNKKTLGEHFQPAVAGLPGIVIKKEEMIENHQAVIELISAKVQPVDENLFVIPSDYKEFSSQIRKLSDR